MLYSDLRWAVRRIHRRPGYSVAFTTILGATLGIGLTIGTVADATIGRALPYDDEATLVSMSESNAEQRIEDMQSSWATVEDWQVRARGVSSVGAVRTQLNMTLSMGGEVARVSAGVVSRSMFEVLGAAPAIGRGFSVEEDRPGSNVPSVILGAEAWRDRFAGDPDVIGRSVLLNGRPWTVVGVADAERLLAPHYAEVVDVWLPVGMADQVIGPDVYTNRQFRMFQVIARLAPGTSVDNLEQEAGALGEALASDYPDSSRGWRWDVEPLRDRVLRGVDLPIKALLVGGILLFAVAVVNLVALHIQRSSGEHGDLETRLAIGATVTDVTRLNAVELGVRGLLAGLMGVALSAGTVPLLPRWLPLALPPHVDIDFSWGLAALGVLASVGALVLMGLASIGKTMRAASGSLAVGRRGVGRTAGASFVSRTALALQVALTTVLAIASVMAVRSLSELASMDTGVRPERMMTFRVDVPAEDRGDGEVVVLADDILRGIEAIPSVSAAFLWSPHVPTAATWFTRIRLADRPDVPDSELPAVRINSVSAGAVGRIGLEVVAGRDLREEDRTSGRRVVLVSESSARQWWGSAEAALGRSIRRWNGEESSEVVGVVADAALSGRQGEGSDFFTDVYFLFENDTQRDLVFFARASEGADIDVAALRAVVAANAPDLPPYDMRWMADRLRDQEALARSSAWLATLYAVTAVVLAALGIYGSISFVVGRKQREIGLRQALGAEAGRVAVELLRGEAVVVLLGLGAGTLAALVGMRRVAAALVGVGPRDPASYATAIGVLLVAASVALVVPAVRVVRTSPGESLRDT